RKPEPRRSRTDVQGEPFGGAAHCHVRRPFRQGNDRRRDAGVSAYIVDGLRKDRVKPILDTTISRFNAFAKLKKELETAKSQLDDRKAIDRAKALVMRVKAIPEEQAYALMRQVAMNENKKIAEVARSIITAAELLR